MLAAQQPVRGALAQHAAVRDRPAEANAELLRLRERVSRQMLSAASRALHETETPEAVMGGPAGPLPSDQGQKEEAFARLPWLRERVGVAETIRCSVAPEHTT